LSEGLEKVIERLIIMAQAVYLGRDWAHEPANVINPISLAEWTQTLAVDNGLKCTILDETALAEIGAGGILAVGKGSQTPSRMIILEYQGDHSGSSPIVLAGKAITFDTGGYSLKDTTNIQGMKYDKCGGIAVIATLQAISQLKPPVNVVGIIGAAENMISSTAYRPDDILTTLSGKTVEVISTDAEGRLVLADVLTYAQKHYNPSAIVDLATLTGGVIVALGRVFGGIMGNSRELIQNLIQSGETTGERLWQLPLDEEYLQALKGDDADLKNSGGREGHAILGGIFLQQFVENDIPWAHIDIAGVASTPKDLPYIPKGPSGFGVRLLLEFLEKSKPV
jgi:leucyl aminopeptidase